jgi:O-glycosyl hydrolase
MALSTLLPGLLLLGLLSLSSSYTSYLTQCDAANGDVLNLLAPSFQTITNSTNYFSVNIDIDVSISFQQIMGYGAGLPQASAFVLRSLKDRNLDLYQQVLKKLFTNITDGANMNFLRFPIGSCDFSMISTSFDEVADDYDLSEFAVDSDSYYIVEVLQDVLLIRPDMQLIGN